MEGKRLLLMDIGFNNIDKFHLLNNLIILTRNKNLLSDYPKLKELNNFTLRKLYEIGLTGFDIEKYFHDMDFKKMEDDFRTWERPIIKNFEVLVKENFGTPIFDQLNDIFLEKYKKQFITYHGVKINERN